MSFIARVILVAIALLSSPAWAGPTEDDLATAEQAWDDGHPMKAMTLWWPLAVKGNPQAQYWIAKAYSNGCTVPLDEKQAMAWWFKSAAGGYAPAEMELGDLYWFYGIKTNTQPVKVNDKQAFYWFKRAGNRGHLPALLLLGEAYHLGKGVLENKKQALYWYRKAAAQGSQEAKDAIDGILNPRELPKKY